MRRVLIDTSGLFAFVSPEDKAHAAALQFVARLARENGRLVLLDWIFAESMTLMKARLQFPIVRTIGHRIRSDPFYVWHPIDAETDRVTWQVFIKYADKQWSYQDCALLAASRQLRINEIFSFDYHFDQMPGIRRVPK